MALVHARYLQPLLHTALPYTKYKLLNLHTCFHLASSSLETCLHITPPLSFQNLSKHVSALSQVGVSVSATVSVRVAYPRVLHRLPGLEFLV